jgi:hypothetical protein
MVYSPDTAFLYCRDLLTHPCEEPRDPGIPAIRVLQMQQSHRRTKLCQGWRYSHIFDLGTRLPMNCKPFIFSLSFLVLFGQSAIAQAKYSKLLVDRQMKDTFSFAKQWDYSWEIFKDGSTGEFKRNDDHPIVAADTAHLFHTANCLTNVQGGYAIRHCLAVQSPGTIMLTFSDGLPAYASQFYLYIKGDSFCFKPKTAYPMYIPGQKISYQVTQQKLTLDKSSYNIGETIIGYVDAEFIETVFVPKKGTQTRTFYLRGYIRTPLVRPI